MEKAYSYGIFTEELGYTALLLSKHRPFIFSLHQFMEERELIWAPQTMTQSDKHM